ncbi:MAG: PLP-dependent aminotransferase family protein [Acidobacteriota bacterium]
MELDLHVDRDGNRPIFLQIVEELEARMDAGNLPDRLRLPPSRELAARLGVNRNTVVSAYQELIARGRATAHTGRGTFLRTGGGSGEEPRPWSEAAGTVITPDAAELQGIALGEARFAFAANFPPEELLPSRSFREILDTVLRRDGARLLNYGSPAGYRPLREWIAGEMGRRGAPVDAEDVIVTTGSQQAIDLAGRALLRPGDRVLMERPGFTLAIGSFRAQGAQVEGIPIDEEGIRTDLLARAMHDRRPRLVYLVPEFHNPTGVTLSERRRRQLLELAHENGVAVVEDDSGGWLRFAGQPLTPLRGLDRHGLTLFLATFSKMLMPGIRVGWLCAPRSLRDRVLGLKQLTDCTTSLLLQAAVHEFCARGLLDEHLAMVRRAYRERRDAMVAAMRRHFPPEISWTEPDGGLALWVTLPRGLDARDVLAEARSRGIVFNPGELFYADAPRRNHLRLTFGAVTVDRIREGIRELGDVLRGFEDRLAAERRGVEATPLV